MKSFKKTKFNLQIPLGAVWLMNSVSEYKGKQDLYTKQSPQVLKTLVQIALIESAESSNRIEGVTVERKRLKPLIIGRSKPKDRSEEEVAGYRKALDLIHKKYKSMDISPEIIKELHRLSHGETGDAGQWKKKNNEIIRKNSNGSVDIVFKPLEADLVPKAINSQVGEFSISDIEKECSGVSRDMIRLVFRGLKKKKKIKCLGKGQSAKWVKT